MEIVLKHALTYTTKGDVPVHIVAKSLLANERLARESALLLERATPGLRIEAVRVAVRHVSNASPLREALAVGLFLTFQQDLEKEVPDLIQKLTGYNVPDSADTLMTVLVVMLAMRIISTAIDRVFPGRSVKELKAEYERKKERVAELIGVSAETIEKLASQAVVGESKPALFMRAYEFFLPAKIESNVEILGDGDVLVSRAAIQEIPAQLDGPLVEGPSSYKLEGVVIDIHRSDRDQNKHGWRAVVDVVSDKKVRTELAADIQPSELYGKTTVIGDVVVTEGFEPDGEPVIKSYYIIKLYTDPPH